MLAIHCRGSHALTKTGDSSAVVVSVGYERRSPEELARSLLSHGVRRVLDIRELPVSRRPGFSKTALSEYLAEQGIEYRHLRFAGNPHRKLKGNVAECLRRYTRHLQATPEVLGLVAEELQDGPVAFLCYERDASACHRSILLRFMRERGVSIRVVEVT